VTERRAALIGFVAASVVPSLRMAILALPWEPGIRSLGEAALFVGVAFSVALPFSVLPTLIIGVPGFLLCRRVGLVTWWLALGVGAVAGVLVAVARPANQPVADMLVKYVLLGAAAGLTFWVVWKKGATDGSA
jgi:hypothetical protein